MGENKQNELIYRKSNSFVAAKYRSSLLENQVMAIAQSRIELNHAKAGHPLEAHLYPGELSRLVSDPAHVYRDLKRLSTTLNGHTMVLEDGRGNFKSFAIIPNADYENGELVIRFNDVLKDHMLYSKKLENMGYSKYALSIILGFEKNSSLRTYELLARELYRIPEGSAEGVSVEYNLSELRFIIGIANIDDPKVQDAMKYMGKNIDWDKLYNVLDKKSRIHEEYRDFNRRVLKVAQEEISRKSDLRFEYETISKARKVVKIIFTIYRNIPEEEYDVGERILIMNEAEEEYRQLELPLEFHSKLYEEYVGHNELTSEDIDLLLYKAKYDEELVESAIKQADSAGHIENYMGWLIKCIERGGYKNVEVLDGSAEVALEVREVQKEYEANKTSISEAVWAKVTTNEDFGRFLHFLEENSLGLEQFEAIYSCEERFKIYTDWKFDRNIEFFW